MPNLMVEYFPKTMSDVLLGSRIEFYSDEETNGIIVSCNPYSFDVFWEDGLLWRGYMINDVRSNSEHGRFRVFKVKD